MCARAYGNRLYRKGAGKQPNRSRSELPTELREWTLLEKPFRLPWQGKEVNADNRARGIGRFLAFSLIVGLFFLIIFSNLSFFLLWPVPWVTNVLSDTRPCSYNILHGRAVAS
jgi:hypothetical protein